MSSVAIQVHGGVGYVEETGVARLWRDARIAPIYEGTNGIQAIDLVTRKLPLAGGDAIRGLLDEARRDAQELGEGLSDIRDHLIAAIDATSRATEELLDALDDRIGDALTGATTYASMLGSTLGGWLMARSARIAAERGTGAFESSKVATARFYADHILSTVPGLLAGALAGRDTTFGVPEESLRRG